MLAILGPSGAGKTTLLDVLAGRHTGSGVSGEVRLSGHVVSPHVIKHVAGCAGSSVQSSVCCAQHSGRGSFCFSYL